MIDNINKKQCSCCGEKTLDKDSIFEICSVCGWQDDEFQNENPDYAGGANEINLNQAKKQYREKS